MTERPAQNKRRTPLEPAKTAAGGAPPHGGHRARPGLPFAAGSSIFSARSNDLVCFYSRPPDVAAVIGQAGSTTGAGAGRFQAARGPQTGSQQSGNIELGGAIVLQRVIGGARRGRVARGGSRDCFPLCHLAAASSWGEAAAVIGRRWLISSKWSRLIVFLPSSLLHSTSSCSCSCPSSSSSSSSSLLAESIPSVWYTLFHYPFINSYSVLLPRGVSLLAVYPQTCRSLFISSLFFRNIEEN